MQKACVIGDPIAHSLSPVIHGYWLKDYGIDGIYDRVHVLKDQLPDFVKSLAAEGYAGMNVTIPHKEAVAKLVNQLDESAAGLGAVNTVWFENGRMIGGNSDVYGFLANLDQGAPGWSEQINSAWVLGAGGAARAVAFALHAKGLKNITITNRSREKAVRIVNELIPMAEIADWSGCDPKGNRPMLIVNTTSLGMTGHQALPVRLDAVPEGSIVCDIVYSPLETDLLKSAGERGMTAVDGLGMLLHQAALGFEKWFGVKPEVTASQRQTILDVLNR